MSDSLAERLSRFTPDATGLDRDALLFAAGRASVRPPRRWQMLAGALAACQLATLVCLWPRTPSPTTTSTPHASYQIKEEPRDEVPSLSPPTWTPRWNLLTFDLEKPDPPSDEPMTPPEPPLHAFGTPPDTILN
jgi:hypothetical protein